MPIIADEKDDDDGETLTLSDASGAAIADAAATGTIADAEPALPGQSVSDVEASEEDDAALSFAVTLDAAATGRVTDGGLRYRRLDCDGRLGLHHNQGRIPDFPEQCVGKDGL